MTSRVWKTLLAGGLASAVIGIATLATVDRQPAHADSVKHPVVLELFTSQGCYSCPAAEAFLGELIDERRDIIALEWHVDYWDKLVYRGSSWKDPFSDASFTERQQTYASQLRGRVYGYTPQMVIDGKREAVGSNRSDVLAAMKASAAEPKLVVSATTDRAGNLAISVDGADEGDAAIWVVTYLKSHFTEVIGGENKGKSLANHNIVRAADRVGRWNGETVAINATVSLDADQGCVVLVQADRQGPVLGAARRKAAPTPRTRPAAGNAIGCAPSLPSQAAMVATAALIFDLDGVLVDSELLIGREVSAALRPFNIDLPPGDYHARFHYVRLERMAETISAEHGVALPDDFVPQLRKRLNVAYASDLEAVPGAAAMLRAVTHPVAVASGSVPEGIDLKLRRTGLYDFFAPHIYSVFDVGAARKPAPDVFLYTAEKLGLAPADCIVIEDASAGVTAGIAAGMRVLGFTGGGHAYPGLSEKLKAAGAAEVFDDLADLITLI